MDLPEPQEQFEQEPMDEQAEEQVAPADVMPIASSSDPKPATLSLIHISEPTRPY